MILHDRHWTTFAFILTLTAHLVLITPLAGWLKKGPAFHQQKESIAVELSALIPQTKKKPVLKPKIPVRPPQKIEPLKKII